MGVLNQLLIADPSDGANVIASEDPAQHWDGFTCRGLDRITLATLWALIESGTPDARFDERLGQIRTIVGGNEGPWVDVVPIEMLDFLARIAAMEDDEQEKLALNWSETEELARWEFSEVLDALRSTGDLAETAQLENKTLLIWTSL